MSAPGKNGLRMPFAEWLYRMAEADVPYQARGLAMYAVLFKVSANDELAKLAGMDTKGIADKTYNKWKKLLADDGWVIVKSVTVGRETTIEIYPALETSPVTFTDVSPRDPARFAQNKSYGREEQVTGESYGPAVTITNETEKVTDGKVTFTAEEKTSPAPARAEDNKNIYNNYNNLPEVQSSPVKQTSEQVAASAKPLDLKNLDYDALSEKLLSACNGSLDDPVNCMGLASLATPIMWLREGCDLDADILPTLRAFGKVYHGKRVRTWNYFTDRINEARLARENGMPPPSESSGKGRAQGKRVPRPEGKTWKEMNDEIIAEEMGGRK